MQLEGETRLYECAVDPRLSRSALIAVFEFDRGEVRDVMAPARNRPRQAGNRSKNRICPGNVNVLKTVVWFPQLRACRQPVTNLDVPCLAINRTSRADHPVRDIGELGNNFWILFLPDHMARLDPLAGLGRTGRRDFVPVKSA